MATLPHPDSDPTALDAVRAFRVLSAPHRFRVIRDTEGWPVIPGKLGRIEWHDGAALAVYTNRPRLCARLWAVAGVRRWQVGDQEARGLFPAEALPTVATLIRARKRRAGHPAALRNLVPAPRHSVTSAA